MVGALALYFAFIGLAMFAALPLTPATLLAAKSAPPWAVALVAAAAALVTAAIDYYTIRRAFQVRLLGETRSNRFFRTAERWATRAPFWTTGLFAGFPLPFVVVRVLVPLSGYPFRRYATAVVLGRFVRVFVIASFGTFFDIPTPVLIALLAGGVLFAATMALARRFGWLETKRTDGEPPPPPDAPTSVGDRSRDGPDKLDLEGNPRVEVPLEVEER